MRRVRRFVAIAFLLSCCAVIGSEQMMRPGEGGIRRAKLRVIFGSPVTFSRGQSREEIVETIMSRIAALLAANGRVLTIPSDRLDENQSMLHEHAGVA